MAKDFCTVLYVWLHINCELFVFGCSISLDPLYPSRCSWETFSYASGCGMGEEREELSPLSLGSRLNSLGCSVSFHHGESVSIVKLIEQVSHTQWHILQNLTHPCNRTVTYSLRNTFAYCTVHNIQCIYIAPYHTQRLFIMLFKLIN